MQQDETRDEKEDKHERRPVGFSEDKIQLNEDSGGPGDRSLHYINQSFIHIYLGIAGGLFGRGDFTPPLPILVFNKL